MRLRSEAKVGLIVFAGIAILVTIYWFLGGLSLTASSYPVYAVFDNIQKLDKGAVVRMAGVKIGIVSSTSLVDGSKARVDMLIWNDNKFPADSIARVSTGGFIGDNFVEILPGKRRKIAQPEQMIRAETTIQPEQLLEQAGAVLTQITESAESINGLLGDKKTLATIKDTITALSKVAKSASEMTASVQNLVDRSTPEIARTVGNLADATAGAQRVSCQLEDMVATDVRPNLKSALRNAGKVMDDLDTTILEAQDLIGSMKLPAGAVGKSYEKINSALDNVEKATDEAAKMLAQLNEASTGIKDLTTDKQLQANLKRTLQNAADASEQAKLLLCTLNRKIGGLPSFSSSAKPAVPEYGVSTNSLWNTGQGDYRFDAYYTLAAAQKSLYRIGAYNIGENTQAIIQGGKAFTRNDAVRYGIYASRVGLGYDHRFGRNLLLSAELFRPDAPEMELRGIFGITDSFGVYAGVPDLFHSSGRDAMVGIRYQSGK